MYMITIIKSLDVTGYVNMNETLSANSGKTESIVKTEIKIKGFSKRNDKGSNTTIDEANSNNSVTATSGGKGKPAIKQLVNDGPQNFASLLNQMSSKTDGESDNDDGKELNELRKKIRSIAYKYDEFEDEYDDAYDEKGFAIGDDLLSDDEDSKRQRDMHVSDTQPGVKDQNKDRQQWRKNMNMPKPAEKTAIVDAMSDWKEGMLDVDGMKRDVNGKIIEEDEDDVFSKPNPNHANRDSDQPRGHKWKSDQSQGKGRGRGRGGRGGGSGRRDTNDDKGTSTKGDTASNAKTTDDKGDIKISARDAKYRQKNKSRIGNHSRKRGAAKKQAKGMFG
mmetsp:Transcript_14199/g.17586  ORF Transcript_14199/g.17586 Transcript_14199/m.17586 type:complete len:334 (+) Transcript_14199:1-1002(+)